MALKWNQASGQSDKWGIILSRSVIYVRDGITQDCLEIHHRLKWGCTVTSPVVSGEYLSEYAIRSDSLAPWHGIGDYFHVLDRVPDVSYTNQFQEGTFLSLILPRALCLSDRLPQRQVFQF
jgi:hypothetical protein